MICYLLKLIEYPPVLASCCSWKLSVDSPNGFRIAFPSSLSFPEYNIYIYIYIYIIIYMYI